MGESGWAAADLGALLWQLRERAGVKQAELAKLVGLSPAVLSRIESGERSASPEEARALLEQLGTDAAASLAESLDREWQVLPRPPLDHPDQKLLWDAEVAAQALVANRDEPSTYASWERRLTAYIEELRRAAERLLRREHQVAFIGSIGVGKSTAICRVANLEVRQDDGTISPVLEVGAGGTTICEVHLRTGPSYGIIIEPKSDDELRQDVLDLADSVMKSALGAEDEGQESSAGSEAQGISKEVSRALRNMSDLAVQRVKDVDGKRRVVDPAKELAERFAQSRDFAVEVLSRMQIHRRDRRDVWFESSSGRTPKAWLRETFAQINNGRSLEFTLPKRIEVVVPETVLPGAGLPVRIIDTKGIDRTVAREDLEAYFDDPHTLVVLCSAFNSAPGAEIRLLLERARDAAKPNLRSNVALLALPRSGEAIAMKDDANGERVSSAQEGYELKGEQVELSLEPLGLRRLPVAFFDAGNESADDLRSFLRKALDHSREAFRQALDDAVTGSHALIKDRRANEVRAVIQSAGSALRTAFRKYAVVPPVESHVQEGLITQLHVSYASTVRAAIRREGEWAQLSYSHLIGYGSRKLAVTALAKGVQAVLQQCELMLEDSQYTFARETVSQVQRLLAVGYEEILRKVYLMGQAIFKEALRDDPEFWAACRAEWGQGPGFKVRVAHRNVAWFKSEQRGRLEAELKAVIDREWAQLLNRLSALLEPEG